MRATGIPYPTLAGIENGDQKGSTRLHVIAAKLAVNVHYLESGKGEPEDLTWHPEVSVPQEWHFLEELKEKISDYNDIERDVVHLHVLKAIQKVENGRRKPKNLATESNTSKKELAHENKDRRRHNRSGT